MVDSIRYVTDNAGRPVGVLLDLEAYHQLANPLLSDRKCLVGLSREELLVLANCKISPAEQARLDALLAKNTEAQLSSTETDEVLRIELAL
jgi:hypothetical protein